MKKNRISINRKTKILEIFLFGLLLLSSFYFLSVSSLFVKLYLILLALVSMVMFLVSLKGLIKLLRLAKT